VSNAITFFMSVHDNFLLAYVSEVGHARILRGTAPALPKFWDPHGFTLSD